MNENLKQYEVLNWASLFLEENNCEANIAGILLKDLLQVTDTQFYLNMRETVPQQIVDHFTLLLHKHVDTGVPVEHLTGYTYFYDRKFFVNKNVLIPRPETEELVDHVISHLQKKKQTSLNIADVGTGSGIIAVTMALAFPEANVFATDLSKEALKIAEKNASFHEASINFFQGNFLEPIIEQGITLHYLLANPPYIKTSVKDELSRTVRDFEPEMALFSGADGLNAYREIIAQIPQVATKGMNILFEIGYDQGLAVRSLLEMSFPDCDVKVIQDIHGKDRIVHAQIY